MYVIHETFLTNCYFKGNKCLNINVYVSGENKLLITTVAYLDKDKDKDDFFVKYVCT